ncbi:hypothetical protein PAXINDRAFT_157446 [Paxillus involutus ATCC 200175]|uniref:Uncharacterized protein n=1 Tax=Paxillus involutus ATCC 200175 TaxID=664439 RepID=A0A0C9TK12_PAXIN|nr:hypothetical protein PAXINDRAFT_157446 [Paxillus involutus ATCC 200175]
MLLVWNLQDGVDVYHFTNLPANRFTSIRKLRVKIRTNHPNQVVFDSHGKLAIGGSDNGEVYLWKVDSGERVQTLTHGRETPLKYHYSQSSKHLITSGLSQIHSNKVAIKVWVLTVTKETDVFALFEL